MPLGRIPKRILLLLTVTGDVPSVTIPNNDAVFEDEINSKLCISLLLIRLPVLELPLKYIPVSDTFCTVVVCVNA